MLYYLYDHLITLKLNLPARASGQNNVCVSMKGKGSFIGTVPNAGRVLSGFQDVSR